MKSKIAKNRITRGIVLSLLISLLLASAALAATQDRLQKKITISCRDLPIETFLVQLAEQANIDIIKSPKVTGNVTVKLTDIPLEEILDNVLAVHGYTYKSSENMIRVLPVSEVSVKEKPKTRFYTITYADAEEVAIALEQYVSKDGAVVLNKGTSDIMVTDTESKIKDIDEFIKRIDRVTPQVLVEVRIYDITTNESFDLDVQWHAMRNTPIKTTETTNEHVRTDTGTSAVDTSTTTRTDNTTSATDTFTTTRTDTGTSATDTFVTTITDTVDTVDPTNTGTVTETITTQTPETSGWSTETATTTTPETSGWSTVTETTTTPEEHGWTTTDTDTVTETEKSWLTDAAGNHVPMRKSKPFVGAEFSPGKGGAIKFALINDMVDLEFVLTMLHSQLDAKLLANPRVLVLDNETAFFKSVQEIPYVDLSETSAGGSMTTIKFKDVGINLEVTPHVARNEMIRLRVIPEFNVTIAPLTQAFNLSDRVPVIDTRRADTTAMINNGQTIVIGGLRRTNSSRQVDKFPVLGDLPLIGSLFRAVSESETTNEIVVFITAKIITNYVLTEDEKIKLRQTDFQTPTSKKAKAEREASKS